MAVVHGARQLYRSIDKHSDAPTEEFFGTNGRPELTGALRFVTYFVETLLNPQRRHFELVAGHFEG